MPTVMDLRRYVEPVFSFDTITERQDKLIILLDAIRANPFSIDDDGDNWLQTVIACYGDYIIGTYYSRVPTINLFMSNEQDYDHHLVVIALKCALECGVNPLRNNLKQQRVFETIMDYDVFPIELSRFMFNLLRTASKIFLSTKSTNKGTHRTTREKRYYKNKLKKSVKEKQFILDEIQQCERAFLRNYGELC